MKRNFFKSMLLTGLLTGMMVLFGSSAAVMAEQTAPIEVNWHVDYRAGRTAGVLDDSSFNAEEIDAKLGAMQPGDRIIFTISLNNQKQVATRWYMENEVMRSMERLATDTGAYSYVLSYNGNVINNSEELGGATDSEAAVGGMTPATAGLEDFFELGSIAAGGTGTVKLEIELEGESQGNSYQNAQARIRFHFAVDETGANLAPTITPAASRATARQGNVGTIVKTGDEFNKLKYLTALAAAGVVLLVLAVFATKKRRTEEAVDERDEQKGGR